MTTYSFGDFLLDQIEKRNMSVREFSELVGVSHTVIHKFLDYGKKDVGYPSMDFLFKLSKATLTDAGTLVHLLIPNLSEREVTPQSRRLAERISQLPERDQRMIEAIVDVIIEQQE